MNILVINGPNMNMLGIREAEIYGRETYDDLVYFVSEAAEELRDGKGESIDLTFFQSNHEGAIIDEIQDALGEFDGIVINPAAYTHTSIAIADAIKAVGIPTVEVHLTNPKEREDYRKVSFVEEACLATVKGMGFQGYVEALKILCRE